MPKIGGVEYRAANEGDETYANALFRRLMSDYVERSWDDEKERQACYERNYRRTGHIYILEKDGERIGYLAYERKDDGYYLDQIHLEPDMQGQGIGTRIVKDILAMADAERLPVELVAFRINPVVKLYQRLGFAIERQDEARVFMRYPVMQRTL